VGLPAEGLQETVQESKRDNATSTYIIVRRPALKQLHVNQPHTTMTHYYS
jgi:hypothetical protein